MWQESLKIIPVPSVIEKTITFTGGNNTVTYSSYLKETVMKVKRNNSE